MKMIFTAVLTVFLVLTGVLFPLAARPSLASASDEPIQIESVSTHTLKEGDSPVIEMVGQGFNEDISASLIQKTVSSQVVRKVYPVPGVINDSLVVGNVLFLAESHNGGVLAINIGDPDQPRLFGEYLFQRAVLTLHRFDQFLFAVCRDKRISVLRIESDGRLTFLKDIETPIRVLELKIDNGYMVVAAGAEGVLLYRLGPDLDATLLHHLRTSSPVNNIEMSDSHLYWSQKDGLAVLAVSKERLELLDVVSLKHPGDLCKAHGDLFVAGRESLYRLSLETPEHPTLMFELQGFRDIVRLLSGDENFYVIDDYLHLVILDPVTMTVANQVSLESDTRIISEKDGRIYAAGLRSGLKIFDTVALNDSIPLRILETDGRCYDLQKIDHWLYAATKRGLLRMNLESEKGAFVPFGLRKDARAFSLDEERRRLYVAYGNSGVGVFDVSVPDDVREVAFWKDLPAMKLVIAGDLLVVSRGAYGINLIDISQLQEAVVLQSLSGIHVLDMAVEDNILFVASKEAGLLSYQMTPDKKAKKLGSAEMPFPMSHFSRAASVVIDHPYAYVANGRLGLTVVDIRKPDKMKIVDLLNIEGFAKKVAMEGDHLLVASQVGVSVVDIQNPSNPQIEGYFPIQGLSRGLSVIGDQFFASLNGTGIAVVTMPIVAQAVVSQKEGRMRIAFPPIQSSGVLDLFIGRDGEYQILKDVVFVSD